jgi:hypothetical protein
MFAGSAVHQTIFDSDLLIVSQFIDIYVILYFCLYIRNCINNVESVLPHDWNLIYRISRSLRLQFLFWEYF